MTGSMGRRRLAYLLGATCVAVGIAGALAPVRAQTVDDILRTKKIVIGLVQDFPPFAMLDADQKPVGYDVDVANLIGKYLGVEVELLPVSTSNRIPYLLSKRVDVLVASLGVTPERSKQVAFTIPYAATQSTVVAPASANIKTLDDLKDLRVAVGRGSSNDLFITRKAPPGVNLQRFDSEVATAQALTAGQVDAAVLTNTMVPSVIASAPQAKLEVKVVIQQQENAMALRRDETDLRLWLNEFIYYIKTNGDLDAIHRKWLKSPLPELHTF